MVYEIFDKKSSGSDAKTKIIASQQLAKELHKPIVRKCEKRKVYSFFKGNIWGADICNCFVNLKKDFNFCYVLLIFIVNMHELLPWEKKKLLQLFMLFKIF